MAAELLYTDGQKDRHAEGNIRFSKFCEHVQKSTFFFSVHTIAILESFHPEKEKLKINELCHLRRYVYTTFHAQLSVYKLSIRKRLIEYYVNVSRNFLKLKENSDTKIGCGIVWKKKMNRIH